MDANEFYVWDILAKVLKSMYAIELCFCEQRVAKKGTYLRKRIMPVNTISVLLSFTFIKMAEGHTF